MTRTFKSRGVEGGSDVEGAGDVVGGVGAENLSSSSSSRPQGMRRAIAIHHVAAT